MKQVLKYSSLLIACMLLLMLAGLMNDHLQNEDNHKKTHNTDKTYTLTIKNVEVTEKQIVGTNKTTKTFKINTKQGILHGETVLDIQPKDKIKYQFVNEESKEIRILEKVRQLKA